MGHDDPHHPHSHHPHEHQGHAPTGASSVVDEHHRTSADTVSTWVITCSDSRTAAEDTGGDAVAVELQRAGHTLAGRSLVKEDPQELRAALDKAIGAGARAVIVTGGTGLSRRDTTAETLEALYEKRIPGFGELFRMLSYEEIGPAAMLSRATAGAWRGAMLFAVPGSPGGARLATARLIAPELGHLLREVSR